MAEPQPTPPPPHGDADVEEPPPTNAEDRKAAAALSSLVARDEDDGKLNGKAANHVDQEALGRAISRLEMSSAGGKGVAGKEGDGKGKGKGKEEVAKKVKVDQVDVGLLVEELELSKGKATELLKMHDGDAVRAMTAYLKASV